MEGFVYPYLAESVNSSLAVTGRPFFRLSNRLNPREGISQWRQRV